MVSNGVRRPVQPRDIPGQPLDLHARKVARAVGLQFFAQRFEQAGIDEGWNVVVFKCQTRCRFTGIQPRGRLSMGSIVIRVRIVHVANLRTMRPE